MNTSQDIWEKVIDQIRYDIEEGELQCLYQMLQGVPKDVLIAYLPEAEED